MVIDNDRLQGAAWAEFHTARKRLDKATRDLHRHEEVDVPAFDAWLYSTFPLLVTALRELIAEVKTKGSKVAAVQAEAAFAGGSLKRLWRKQKEREAEAAAHPEGTDEATEDEADEEPRRRRRQDARPDDFERARGPKPSAAARDIYRRLVQRLHPDRGGDWTAARQRLWHEVQLAWESANADWLARLESEWETAHEVIGPASPLSRIRRAIEELQAARRDLEQKLRDYRASPQWRFTRNEKNRAALHRRVEHDFTQDITFLREQRDHLDRTIAAWEDDWTKSDSRPKPRRHRGRQR